MERNCIVFLKICIQFLIKKKKKKVKLFFKKVLTSPRIGVILIVEINKKEKSAILDIITI